jgi:hypothetical protein
MRLKDGYQTCPRCQGQGCYRCHKQGFLVQCPICANSELELMTKNDDQYRCGACGGEFTKAGDVVLLPAPPVKKPTPKKKPT